MALRLSQSAALNKPIIAGEAGILAGAAPGCISDGQRNALFAAKEQAQFLGGSSGLLAWDWMPSASGACSYDIGPTDPLLTAGGAIG